MLSCTLCLVVQCVRHYVALVKKVCLILCPSLEVMIFAFITPIGLGTHWVTGILR